MPDTTPEEVARIRAEGAREALESFAAKSANHGLLGRAYEARAYSALCYPAPPKRVRAEVALSNNVGAYVEGDSIALHGRGNYGSPLWIGRKDHEILRALDARADAEGFVEEGETAPPAAPSAEEQDLASWPAAPAPAESTDSFNSGSYTDSFTRGETRVWWLVLAMDGTVLEVRTRCPNLDDWKNLWQTVVDVVPRSTLVAMQERVGGWQVKCEAEQGARLKAEASLDALWEKVQHWTDVAADYAQKLDSARQYRDHYKAERDKALRAVRIAAHGAIEEHEARLCPEDMGCEELIDSLRAQLAETTGEVPEKKLLQMARAIEETYYSNTTAFAPFVLCARAAIEALGKKVEGEA